MATINDFISPKYSALNPFDLIAGCGYGFDSSLFFVKSKIDPEPILTDILSVDSITTDLFSLPDWKTDNDITKYIFLSKTGSTRVLLFFKT